MSLEIDDFIQLLSKAFEKREERKAWEMWLVNYRNMDEKTFVPFSQFFKLQKQPTSIRSSEDILAEAEEIRANIRGKGVEKE